eukprot:5603381-Amphidinium_carterae.2
MRLFGLLARLVSNPRVYGDPGREGSFGLEVVTGIVTLFSAGGSDVSFLRTVRVLRPLRTLSAMPGMRSLVNTVFLSLPRLKDAYLCGYARLVAMIIFRDLEMQREE